MQRIASFVLATVALLVLPWSISYIFIFLYGVRYPNAYELIAWGMWLDMLYGVTGGGFFQFRFSVTLLFVIFFVCTRLIRRYTIFGKKSSI